MKIPLMRGIMTPLFIFRSLEKVQQDLDHANILFGQINIVLLKFLDFVPSLCTILPPLVHRGRGNVVIFSHAQTQEIRQ